MTAAPEASGTSEAPQTSQAPQTSESVGPTEIAGAAATACDEAWPQLRGAHQGQYEHGVPVHWSEGSQEIRWKTPLPGRGFSSPVVLDGTAWMTTAYGESPPETPSLRLLGVDVETGELRVNLEVFAPAAWQPGHPDNSYASPTPVASDGRVWVHFGTYGTAAFDAAKLLGGEGDRDDAVLWRVHNTPQEHEVGPGSSPILVPGAGPNGQDLLVVHADATDTQAIVALDAASGEIVWRTERFIPENEQAYQSGAHRKAFSTPLYYVYDGTPLLLSTSAAHTSAYDPATGRELWRVRHSGYSNVPMPVAGLGFVWINTGFMKPQLLAVKLSNEPVGPLDVTEERVAWSYHWQVPANPTPLLVNRRLFLISDWGIASWLDALSGEEIWRQRLGGRTFASPLVAAGRIYTWNVEGETKVLTASDEFELLATNQLGAPIRATPAIACGAIFVRTTEALYRIEAP